MFHKKIHNADLSQSAFLTVVNIQQTEDTNGRIRKVRKRVLCTEDVQPSIPKVDNFSLEKQIQAGIDLKPVNTKVLSPSEASVDAHATDVVNKLNESAVQQMDDDSLNNE